jgi:organic hydroperoxide reductase OsmC/OhrA
MIQYPIPFDTRAHAPGGLSAPWSAVSGEHTSTVTVPPEFAGPGGALSPEDLFNQALTSCFIGTFKVYAENSKLTYEAVEAEARLIVDLDENRKPVMKELHLRARIVKPSNRDRALLLARKALQAGFILNSVKTEIRSEIDVVE